MDFFEMVIRLKIIYENKIVIISCGAFFIAIGEDAILLNRELGLKLNCMRKNVCKIGIPKNSMHKYVGKLNKTEYGYVILDYDREKQEIIKICEKIGKGKSTIKYNINCHNCENYKKDLETNYEKAFYKYIKEQFGEEYE